MKWRDSKRHINHRTDKEIELVTKKLPTKKSPGPDVFSDKFYQGYKRELIPILQQLFQIIEEEGTLPKSLYKASISLIPQPKTSQENIDQYLL